MYLLQRRRGRVPFLWAVLALWAPSLLLGSNVEWSPVPGATEYRLYSALLTYVEVGVCDPDTGECWIEDQTSPPTWTSCDVQVFPATLCTASLCQATMTDPVYSAFSFMTARNADPGSESEGITILPCP